VALCSSHVVALCSSHVVALCRFVLGWTPVR